MYVRALTATMLAATASQAHGQRLEAALQDTLTSDPQIAGADARVQAAEAGVDIERASRLPTLGVDVRAGYQLDQTLLGSLRTQTLGVGAGFDMPLYSGGEIKWRIRGARAALEAEQARRDLTINMRLATTADRYGSLYRDVRIEAARVSQVENVETLLTATRERQRAGAVTETDTYQAVARLATSKARLAQARAALTQSQEELREVTGRAVARPEDAEPPRVSIADLPDRLATFPAVKLAAARIAMARAEIRVAQATRAPRLALTSGVQTTNDLALQTGLPPGFRTGAQFGLTLRVPLFQGGAPGARVRQAEQTLAGRQEERRATEMQLVAQIRAQFAQLQAAEDTLPALDRALAASRAALVGVQAEITVGTRSSLDVLNAQEEVTQVEVRIAQVRQQRLALAYAILGIMGQLKPEPPAPRPAIAAKPATAPLRYDRIGLWVWQGSESWSLKPGRRVV